MGTFSTWKFPATFARKTRKLLVFHANLAERPPRDGRSSAKSAHSNSSSSALSASPKDQPRFNCSVGSMQLATVHLFALRLQFRAEAVEILHRLLTAAGTEGRCSRRANMSDFRYKSMVSAPRVARHRHYSAWQPFATVRSTEDRRPDLDPRATSRAVLVDVLRAHKRFPGRRRGRKRPAYSSLGTHSNGSW